MHNCVRIADDLFYLGGNDRRIALFESAYPVPRGVSYNSYLLTDEKTVLFDTVDLSVSDLFFENLAYALGGRGPPRALLGAEGGPFLDPDTIDMPRARWPRPEPPELPQQQLDLGI